MGQVVFRTACRLLPDNAPHVTEPLR